MLLFSFRGHCILGKNLPGFRQFVDFGLSRFKRASCRISSMATPCEDHDLRLQYYIPPEIGCTTAELSSFKNIKKAIAQIL